MKTKLLRLVAEPPQFFWAPILPATANMLLQVTMMLVAMVTANLSPIFFFLTLGIGHAVIAVAAAREPHLSTLATVWLAARRRTDSLIPATGAKYAP